ncbi:hypothetical protein PIB30_050522 [Stylosanthes scabra]|uniref:GRF-type domain-containing protein n=1 Tax=Stylosanthes scabra TaxID=79078 RepID=A0ABU6UJL2_9FABA|nr:hypothetical protein [Stylosanthes scabra]
MQANTSQASGSSSRSRSHRSWARSPCRVKGGKIPQWCGCGMRPVLRWSGTDLNSDRPFYGCPNYNTSGKQWCGLFVWTDGKEDQSNG